MMHSEAKSVLLTLKNVLGGTEGTEGIVVVRQSCVDMCIYVCLYSGAYYTHMAHLNNNLAFLSQRAAILHLARRHYIADKASWHTWP